ncbi:hypothetical protein [Allokutzneria albata]|uniref:Uncharacterized protein n=1 Tax=Allokutzneria albata TaxID=211114 RepID=A0A1H0CB90_ALLAB|nr:hypothetical protein [Allokutzneria albata]SDN55127.1 hypothetical protein SAMN04489726_7125 [Allokutzneria albata]
MRPLLLIPVTWKGLGRLLTGGTGLALALVVIFFVFGATAAIIAAVMVCAALRSIVKALRS